ncbi:ribosome maturation factor RimM [Phosphitispora fastidiosa]|uniref:ribosome maturation factor RimM n=1 Tax=Phosphitispora fastidiosa TaxID=2837202 RepID=UPI001E647E68|nr:ribosome maturation factor RimM [Phosphitispora fastidiosa]MBU7005458.1 16S rRNA processing protein RimM [Phosphitispora fastidiosa]
MKTPMDEHDKLITVGKIVNSQGIKGEVRVWPLTDFSERFKDNSTVLLDINGELRPLTVEHSWKHKNFLVVKFREIIDMNSAKSVKEGLLKVSRDSLRELPRDTFYIFEILGMEVVTSEGFPLGRVKDVIQTGSNDVYVIAGQEKEYLIPAIREIVKNIDRENRLITVEPIEGLLDL